MCCVKTIGVGHLPLFLMIQALVDCKFSMCEFDMHTAGLPTCRNANIHACAHNRVVSMQLCVCMQAIMQAHKHNMQTHMGSHFDFKGFFKVSLPALQVPMAASSVDPELAYGPQKEWVSPILERPWVGPNAVSLIPEGAIEEEVIEALELWGMPIDAWPKTGKTKVLTILSATLCTRRVTQTSLCI